jgi:hypothetical protein
MSAANELTYKLNHKLLLYLFAALVSQVPAMVNRAQNFFDPDNEIFLLFLFQAIFQPSQGFFNSIVYGLYEEHFTDHYRDLFAQCQCCGVGCCRRQHQKTEELPIIVYEQSDEE